MLNIRSINASKDCAASLFSRLHHCLFAVLSLAAITALADEPAALRYKLSERAATVGKPLQYTTASSEKLVFRHDGNRGVIQDAAGKTLHTLSAGIMWAENSPRSFSCYTFSPDGKLLVTGSKFVERPKRGEPTNVGRIEVWDVATGKLLEQSDQRMGSLRSVSFSDDGQTLIYSADRFEIDGP